MRGCTLPPVLARCAWERSAFEGNSVSELAVPAARGLGEWLGSTASDATLLGTPDYEPDGDLWICRQPPVAWFGLQVAPVFVNRITRSGDEVCVSIVEARSEILPGDDREEPGLVGRAVAAAMKRSSFSGRNRLSWRAPRTAAGCSRPTSS